MVFLTHMIMWTICCGMSSILYPTLTMLPDLLQQLDNETRTMSVPPENL